MKMLRWVSHWAVLGAALTAVGCSKHDCDLSSGSDESKFGEIAEMTGGAHSCSVISAELIAVHPDKSIDEIATKYETFLKSKSWSVEVKDHKSTRANGKPLEGKLLLAEAGGKKLTTLVYNLSDTLIETVTSVE